MCPVHNTIFTNFGIWDSNFLSSFTSSRALIGALHKSSPLSLLLREARGRGPRIEGQKTHSSRKGLQALQTTKSAVLQALSPQL